MAKYYKGFNKDMTCRGFQFEEGKSYKEDKAKLCESGFHACENPLDCFGYYAPGESVYHEVELDDVSPERRGDTKVVGKAIKIGAKLDIGQIIKAHFEFVKAHTTSTKQGESYTSVQGGNGSSVQGGECSSVQGGNGSSVQGGNGSSVQGGNRSSVQGGECSVVMTINGKAKAGKGSLIVIAMREWRGGKFIITDYAAALVDGDRIKPDTWYKLVNGEFVEVEG